MVPTMSVPDEIHRAQALVGAGRLPEALAWLTTAADDRAVRDPVGSARLRIEAVQIGFHAGGPERALALAEAALAPARTVGGATEAMALIRMGDALTWVGRHADAAVVWKQAEAIQGTADPSLACERANAALRGGDLAAARDRAFEAVVRARQAESRHDLVDALTIAAMVEIHQGLLREALDAAEQALAATSDEDGVIRTAAIGLVAWVTALLGDAERTLALIAEAAELFERLPLTAPGGFAAGMLAVSQGRYTDAVEAFEAKSAEIRFSPLAQALGIRPFIPSLVEAYARAGRRADAERLLAAFHDAALASGQPRHAAPALRAKGVTYDDLAAFDAALEVHAAWGNRFEEARTLLARGELLRRLGRRVDARANLRSAAERFAQAGAVIWHKRTTAELRAAGDRQVVVSTPRGLGPESLTQQEAAVAALVADGLSNREIADRLFLSVKTIEGHLTTIYGKLGLRSRAQLIATGIGRRGDSAQEHFKGFP
jgi:DNA-binding CsgD family transcriptional regulator